MRTPGRRMKARSGRSWRPLAAVAAGLLVVVVGAFLLGRTVGLQEAGSARVFTGEVDGFADDRRILCVAPDADDLPQPFCDVYFVAPGAGELDVGDRVRVRTVTSRDSDGRTVAGMLVTPVTTE